MPRQARLDAPGILHHIMIRFWAVSELGMSLRELARRLEMSPPCVGFSVERGETIARENGLQLIE
jgi:hypothetical protein